jgi:hypothetical protein
MATEPKDRTGEVWELPTGTSFLVTGPPRRHPVFGPQHPYLRLTRGPSDDSEHDRGVVQELDDKPCLDFTERGWRRLA